MYFTSVFSEGEAKMDSHCFWGTDRGYIDKGSFFHRKRFETGWKKAAIRFSASPWLRNIIVLC